MLTAYGFGSWIIGIAALASTIQAVPGPRATVQATVRVMRPVHVARKQWEQLPPPRRREKIVVEQCRTGRFDDVKQGLFEKWLRLGLLSFGRPGTEGNRYAIESGLKKRDSGECMKDFVDDIRPAVHAAGLRFPDPASLKMELPSDVDWS